MVYCWSRGRGLQPSGSGLVTKAGQALGLDPLDCREPGRCAVIVVVSRLNPVRLDGGDLPSIARVERRSQFVLTDGVRASTWTIVTEAQHIQGSIELGHRRKARHVSWPLATVEGVKQPAVQDRLKHASHTLQRERVSRSELNLDSTVIGLRPGNRQCRLSHVSAQYRQSQRGDVQSVLAGPAARIEHRSGESAIGS